MHTEEVPQGADAMPGMSSMGSMLPDALSPWGMFEQADPIVQAVMIGLVFASVVTWTIWLAKTIELRAAMAVLRRVRDKIGQSKSFFELAAAMGNESSLPGRLVLAAGLEISHSQDLIGDARASEGIKERVSVRLEQVQAEAGRKMSIGTGVLATIGATAPFVGLFGTVWGIMNSFVGIARSQTTNLAVVAPGIAEALLATALGLVAAIPAVVIYNHFTRGINGYRAEMSDARADILCLVSRDLDDASYPGKQE